MATLEQHAARYFRDAGTDDPHFLKATEGTNMFALHYSGGRMPGDTLYSYGTHFPLAVRMPATDTAPDGWYLLNGDRYSVSTNRHQAITREYANASGLPVMILPFSAIRESGMEMGSIIPVAVDEDRWESVTERRRAEDLPSYMRSPEAIAMYVKWGELTDNGDGTYDYTHKVHHLGEAVFYAEYRTGRYDDEGHGIKQAAYFLSAFDEQEGNLYFLAQLPYGATPSTVEEARDALMPPLVRLAVQDLAVQRQGDIFAIPMHEVKTRDLAGANERGAYVLGTNHKATEARVVNGTTYARGILRHRPQWRDPDHRNVKLGDGKTWFALVRNLVPEGRSWSLGGNVD